MFSLSELLQLRATTHRDRLAVVTSQRSLTYGELAERAIGIALKLRNVPVASRQTKTSHLPSFAPLAITAELSLSFIEAWWGAMIGRIPLLLEHPHDPDERRRMQRAFSGVAGRLVFSHREEAEGWSYESSEGAVATPNNAAVLIATSGSSGQPKIVPITEQQLIESARRVNVRLAVDDKSRWMLSLMPAHIGGLSMLVRAAVAGCALVIPENLKRTTLLEFARAHAVTHLSLVPSVAEEFIAAGTLPSSLKVILLGGERITHTQRKALAAVPACYLSYGATETASCIAVARLAEIAELPDAVGTPIADTVVEIVGEEGKVLPVGEIGIVEISGPTVVAHKPTTPQTPHPTWRSTDQGFLDPNGVLHLIGRADDIIISGGIKVSAQEIVEATLTTGLVEQAAVVKAPHPRWGEHPILFITAPRTTSAAQLSAILRTRLGKARAPREIIILEAMPRTTIGKIERALLSSYALSTSRESSPLHHFVREQYTR